MEKSARDPKWQQWTPYTNCSSFIVGVLKAGGIVPPTYSVRIIKKVPAAVISASLAAGFLAMVSGTVEGLLSMLRVLGVPQNELAALQSARNQLEFYANVLRVFIGAEKVLGLRTELPTGTYGKMKEAYLPGQLEWYQWLEEVARNPRLQALKQKGELIPPPGLPQTATIGEWKVDKRTNTLEEIPFKERK